MKIYKINENTDFNIICKLISPEKMGAIIMSKKARLHFFYIKGLSNTALNILKQDALSLGAELITHKEVITHKAQNSPSLLIANENQLSKLIEKEKKQGFKLKDLAKFLQKSFKKPKVAKLMGVLNINNDSFNPSSRVSEADFIQKLEAMLELKPDYIDLGAVSSRPGSSYVGSKEEQDRLKGIFKLISKHDYTKFAKFSLDSFDELSLKRALDLGFKMINDITGLKNENLAKLAKEYECEYCLMHMQNEPSNMQINPKYDDLLGEIEDFFAQKLEILKSYGVEKVVLDVGIGFGKSAEHNLILIKHLEHFLQFEKPLLVGASRKSLINEYFKSEVQNRLAGTLFLHLKAFENGASILRVHDLYEHKQILALHEAMDKIFI
ncbi:dihydropteroate synthase [Campylobacter sp. MIT 99-7217]|uniref:dihydropteroate synthase n=1 Tax=Campylobacter sp. MIT 99-7217 TaxID=535091 RepID=UPI00115AB475|nr:dihydropteroate synthase [Campylobacter sp. MIT 99-7217]TQR33727.1 dihydropteroate synthase [Campylobacter sp. MIT 99-7217]